MIDDLKNQPVSLEESDKAQSIIAPYLMPTQCLENLSLSKLLDAQVFIKYENQNPTGSFKIRGGINLMAQLVGYKPNGVITFSTDCIMPEDPSGIWIPEK